MFPKIILFNFPYRNTWRCCSEPNFFFTIPHRFKPMTLRAYSSVLFTRLASYSYPLLLIPFLSLLRNPHYKLKRLESRRINWRSSTSSVGFPHAIKMPLTDLARGQSRPRGKWITHSKSWGGSSSATSASQGESNLSTPYHEGKAGLLIRLPRGGLSPFCNLRQDTFCHPLHGGNEGKSILTIHIPTRE